MTHSETNLVDAGFLPATGQPVDAPAASYQDLMNKLEDLETLVMSIADALGEARIGVGFQISEAKEWYNRTQG